MEDVRNLRRNRSTYKRFKRSKTKTRAGQGLQMISFRDEWRVLDEQLVKEYGKKHFKCKKILSSKAIAIISKHLEDGKYTGREDEREPPFMAPSPDAKDYSMWCSLCNDYARTLILCAGCRTGVCSTDTDSDIGCVQWAPAIKKSNFIFYCPYCAYSRKKRMALDLRRRIIPRMSRVWFRYDPPVLIVGVTWHQTREPFIDYFQKRLALSYHDDTDLILRVDVAMEGYKHGMDVIKAGEIVTEPDGVISGFLKQYDTAKIVFILDTHCADNGRFIYAGETPESYKACSLLEILRDCTPPEVFECLSDESDTPEHTHKSLILNLACGASVMHEVARYLLTKGHCAEGVVSLADNTTVVGEVASQMGDFAARWVQSASTDFDVIAAMTFPAEWAREHQPVISTTNREHTLYTRYQAAHPDGEPIVCGLGCKVPLRAKPRKKTVRVACTRCKSRCSVPFKQLDRRTVLGQYDLVAVTWPPEPYPVGWEIYQKGSMLSDLDSAPSDESDSTSDSDGDYGANVEVPPPAPTPQKLPQPAPPITQKEPSATPKPRVKLPPPLPKPHVKLPLLPPPPSSASASSSKAEITTTISATTEITTTMITTAAASTSKTSAQPKNKSTTIKIPPRSTPLVRTSSEPAPQKRPRSDSGLFIDTSSFKRSNQGGRR